MTESMKFAAKTEGGFWRTHDNHRQFRLTITDPVSGAIVMEITTSQDAVMNWITNTGNSEPAEATFYGTQYVGMEHQRRVIDLPLAGSRQADLDAAIQVIESILAKPHRWHIANHDREYNYHHHMRDTYALPVIRYVEPGTPVEISELEASMLQAMKKVAQPR